MLRRDNFKATMEMERRQLRRANEKEFARLAKKLNSM